MSNISRGDTSVATIGAANSITFAHVVSGTNTLLVVGVVSEVATGSEANYVINSIKYNGDDLTKIDDDEGHGGASDRSELWYRLSPDDGTHDIVVTFAGNVSGAIAMAVTYAGITQKVPEASIGNHSDSGTDTSTILATVTDDAVVVGVSCNGSAGNTFIMTAGPTELFNTSSGSVIDGALAEVVQAAAGNVTMKWTLGAASRWAQIMAAFGNAATPIIASTTIATSSDSPALQEIQGTISLTPNATKHHQKIIRDGTYEGYHAPAYAGPRATNKKRPSFFRSFVSFVSTVALTTYAGAIFATGNASAHTQSVESPAIVQKFTSANNSCSHQQSGSSPALIQKFTVSPVSSSHTHSSGISSIAEKQIISINNASHVSISGSPTVSQKHIPSLNNANHLHSCESSALSEINSISPANSFHHQGVNEHVINGGMEADSDWPSSGDPVNERSSAQKCRGYYSRHIVSDAQGEGITQLLPNLIAGRNYHISFCYYLPVSKSLHVQFIHNDRWEADHLYDSTAGSWQLVNLSLDNSINGPDINGAEISFLNNEEGDNEFYIDDVSVSEDVILSSTATLSANNCSQAISTSSSSILEKYTLSIANSNHLTSCGQGEIATFAQTINLVSSATSHLLSSGSPTITEIKSVDGNDSSHLQTATSSILTEGFMISVDSASHLQSASQPTLIHSYNLSINSTSHSQLSFYILGNELVTNGDMELDSDWPDTPAAPVTNERSNVQKNGDSFSRHIVNTAGARGAYQIIAGKKAGATYKLEYSLYIVSGTVSIHLSHGDGSSGDVYQHNSPIGIWTAYKYNFNETISGDSTSFSFGNVTGVSTEFYIDDVSLKEKIPVQLTQKKIISPNSASHLQTSELSILTEISISTITPSNTSHLFTSGQPTFSHLYNLGANNATHSQTVSTSGIGELAAGAFVDVLKPITKFTSQFVRTPRAQGAIELVTVGTINAYHYHYATSPTFTFGILTLLPENASHLQTSGSSGLLLTTDLDVDDTNQSQSATSSALTLGLTVTGDDCSHSQTSETPSLIEAFTIIPQSTNHSQSATQQIFYFTIDSANCSHAQSVDSVWMSQTFTISPDSCNVAQSSTSPSVAFGQFTYSITPSSCHQFNYVNDLIKNGNMEYNDLASWWSDHGTPTTNEQSDTRKADGVYSRHLDDPAPNDYAGFEQTLDKVSDTHYGFSFLYFIVEDMYSDDVLRVYVQDGQAGGNLWENNYTTTESWKAVTVNDILETDTGDLGYVTFLNASDTQAIEFYIDRVSFWKHVVLTQKYTLSPNSATQILTSSSPTLSQKIMLEGASCSHSQTSTQPIFSHKYSLSPNSTNHEQSCISSSVIQTYIFSPDRTTQTISSSSPTFEQKIILISNSCSQNQSSTEPTLSLKYSLSPNTANHLQSSGSSSLSSVVMTGFIRHILRPATKKVPYLTPIPLAGRGLIGDITPDNSYHYQSSTSPELTFSLYTILSDDTNHSQYATPVPTTVVTIFYNAFIRSIFRPCAELTAYFMNIPLAGEGITGWISPSKSYHYQYADSISEFSFPLYTVQSKNTTHSQTCESPTITEKKSITPDSASHAQSTETSTLTETKSISPDSTNHSQSCGIASLSHIYIPEISSASQSQTATSPTLTEKLTISPNSTSHAQTCDSFGFGFEGSQTVNPDSSSHIQSSALSELINIYVFSPNSTNHAQSCDSSTLQEVAGVSITPDDCSHVQTSGISALTEKLEISPASSSHLQTATQSTFSIGATIYGDGCQHSQTATQSSLDQLHIISPNNAIHVQTPSESTFVQSGETQGSNCIHAQTASQPSIVQTYELSPNDSSHSQTSGSSSATEIITAFAINNASHSQQATEPTLTEKYEIQPDSATHSQTISTFAFWSNIVVSSCTHSQTASSPTLISYTTVSKWHFHADDVWYYFNARKKQYHFVNATPKYFFLSRTTGHYEYANHAFVIPNVCNHGQTNGDALLNNAVFLVPANCSHQI